MPDKKILIADDDPGIIDVMKIVLEDEGFQVITTMNGGDILGLCSEKPDIIFLDIWMSGSNGNIVCRQLKKDKELAHISVIMFSANGNMRKIANDCGADGFLAKPFELDELLDLIQRYTS
jgi:CheY-like chemotaxis protein